MEPKEKAKDLVRMFSESVAGDIKSETWCKLVGKYCARHAVDLLMHDEKAGTLDVDDYKFWQDVLTEIDNV